MTVPQSVIILPLGGRVITNQNEPAWEYSEHSDDDEKVTVASTNTNIFNY